MEQAQVPDKAGLKAPQWEKVADYTFRLVVPGGWLYKAYNPGVPYVAMCFVPNPATVPTMPAHVPVPYEAGWSDPEARGG